MKTTATDAERAAGRGYETLFVPALFQPWTAHLVEAAGIAEGAQVLDIACGTGVLTRHAAELAGPSGRAVGLDPAPGMLAAAAEVAPQIDWVSGSAEALPFEDAHFDAVVSQFGIMFFVDRAQAGREMARVLKPGGSLAVAFWNSTEHNPAYGVLSAILDEFVGTAAGDALRLPFALGDPSPVVESLRAAGFAEIETATRSAQARFPDARTMIEAELRGWLPLFGITLSEDEIAKILAQVEGRLATYVTPEGRAEFPTSAHIVAARKPA
ncbi:MAG: methyltransferase domain-containing protein [Paracoccaceae bacterium]